MGHHCSSRRLFHLSCPCLNSDNFPPPEKVPWQFHGTPVAIGSGYKRNGRIPPPPGLNSDPPPTRLPNHQSTIFSHAYLILRPRHGPLSGPPESPPQSPPETPPQNPRVSWLLTDFSAETWSSGAGRGESCPFVRQTASPPSPSIVTPMDSEDLPPLDLSNSGTLIGCASYEF